MFETAHRVDQVQLHVERQARRYAVRVELVGGQPFRLQKDLVAVLAGKAVDLVFDARAVARPDPFDHAGVHRRTVQPGADDVVRALVSVRHPARHLARMHVGAAEEREHRHGIEVPGLRFQHREVDGAPVDAGRRAGLQAPLRQLQFFQARRQRHRRRIARAAASVIVQADVNLAVEEGPGREHHRACAKPHADLGDGTDHAIALHQQIFHGLLEQHQVRLVFQAMADGGFVQHAVRLGTGGAHGRPLAGIEDAELDATLVGGQCHGTTQRIDFLDQVPLADAADGRVATHLPQGLDVVRQQQGLAAHACRRQGGLGAGVSAAYHDHIEFNWIQHGFLLAWRHRENWGSGIISRPPTPLFDTGRFWTKFSQFRRFT